ncbi:MAG TPA: YtxH domain-containing protein [Saprospiraceae bacterium]|nr:YtxH domain-containing protein [Saprospiraceae bacterium]
MDNSDKTIAAFIAGAAIGAAFGILFAPAKGSKTRQKLKSEGQKVVDSLEEKMTQAKEKLDSLKLEWEKKVKEATEKVPTNN